MAEKAHRTIKHPLMICKIFSTLAYKIERNFISPIQLKMEI